MSYDLKKKYSILKTITIIIGALGIPWGTFTGFCFGSGQYLLGMVSLCLQGFVALVDGYIWVWVLENMKIVTGEEQKSLYVKVAVSDKFLLSSLL